MTERNPDEVTLNTLHDDLTRGFAEMRSGFSDLKTMLIAGFRGLPTRESSEELVRLLGERNRQLELHIRDQHPEIQPIRHALAAGRRRLAEDLRQLIEARRLMIDDLRRRDNGEPAA